MHKNKDDLEYTGDCIRDRGRDANEQRVQASMQEETAKAVYALRDAVDAQNDLIASQNDLLRGIEENLQ